MCEKFDGTEILRMPVASFRDDAMSGAFSPPSGLARVGDEA
jgi:hypothetical protein